MPWWQVVLVLCGVLLLLALVWAAGLVARRRFLARHGGTFELSHRVRPERAGRGWLLGLGRYSGDRLEWFRTFSLSLRPKRTWCRSELAYTGRREPMGSEHVALYHDHLVVCCRAAGREVEFAMTHDSLMGLQAWLEARPPGTDWTREPVR